LLFHSPPRTDPSSRRHPPPLSLFQIGIAMAARVKECRPSGLTQRSGPAGACLGISIAKRCSTTRRPRRGGRGAQCRRSFLAWRATAGAEGQHAACLHSLLPRLHDSSSGSGCGVAREASQISRVDCYLRFQEHGLFNTGF
jgi:hypothetical protein